MKALTKEQVLDDEGLNTLMCEVEAIVNGRPITKLSDDPRDLEPLTRQSPASAARGTCSSTRLVYQSRQLQQSEMATGTVLRRCFLASLGSRVPTVPTREAEMA